MLFAAAAIAGGTVGIASTFADGETATEFRYSEPLRGCSATDGDTIRCGDERIRLIGIDAPELPGHCRQGRDCVEGDPMASKRNLQRLVARGKLSIERHGHDHYDRTLALVATGERDMSCAQIAAGQAVYVARWDSGGAVRRRCR